MGRDLERDLRVHEQTCRRCRQGLLACRIRQILRDRFLLGSVQLED